MKNIHKYRKKLKEKWNAVTLSAIYYCTVNHVLLIAPHQSSIRKPDIGRNCYLCLPHLHSTPSLWGPCQNIAITYGTEKLKWLPDSEKKLKICYSF